MFELALWTLALTAGMTLKTYYDWAYALRGGADISRMTAQDWTNLAVSALMLAAFARFVSIL